MITNIVLTAILVLASAISGRWLSMAGRPLRSLRFTFHKMFPLLLAGFIIFLWFRSRQELIMELPGQICLYGFLISFALAFLTGALLSFDKLAVPMLVWAHKLSSGLLVLATAYAAYLVFFA